MADMSVSPNRDQRSVEDYKQEQEQKLQKLRSELQKRESNERETSAAAVNHIKKSTEDRVDQVRNEGENRLRYESDEMSRKYNDLKRRAAIQNESLEKQIGLADEHAHGRISLAKQDEAKVLAQTQEQLRDFTQRQNALREQSRTEANHDVEQTRHMANDQLQQVKAKSGEEQARIAADSKKKVEEIKTSGDAQYTHVHDQSQRRLEEVRQDGNIKLQRERDEKNAALGELQKKYSEAASVEQHQGERRLTELQRNNEQKFMQTRDRAIKLNEQTQAEYSGETQRLQVEGESEVHERQQKFDELKKQQAAANQAQIAKLKSESAKVENRERSESLKRMKFESEKLDQGLKQLQADFKHRFDSNDGTFKDSLHNQKQGFLRELYKQKQKYDDQFGIERDRSDDPFYRLKGFEAHLDEKQGSYALTARVAPHDKDTVDIIVKDNKIVISAKRSYQDSYEGDSGSKTSTNSYQTYRQEFKLDSPVIPDQSIRKVADDGTITVIAPKRGK
jgi:hypothetical protein